MSENKLFVIVIVIVIVIKTGHSSLAYFILYTNAKATKYQYICKVILNHTLTKQATIHQVATMLTTSKNVLFPGHNHLLTTSTDDPLLSHWHSGDDQSVGSSVLVAMTWK